MAAPVESHIAVAAAPELGDDVYTNAEYVFLYPTMSRLNLIL